ncbi:MAG: DMT family transporter, partial [Anaerovoracaceae bacterium]
MSGKTKGIILAITAATMWGIMGIFVRGLQAAGYTVATIGFVRCLVAAVTLLALTLILNPSSLKISMRGFFLSIFVGMAIYGLSYSTYSAALERIPLGIATVLMFLSPVWVALLSTFVFGEKLTGSKLLAIGICLFGAVLVSDFIGASAGAMDGLGIFFALLNGIGLALQVVIPKFLKQWYSNEATLTYGFFGAAILFAFFTDFSIFPATLAGGASLSILFYILGIGLLCTLVANVSYVKAANYI